MTSADESEERLKKWEKEFDKQRYELEAIRNKDATERQKKAEILAKEIRFKQKLNK